MVAVGLALGSVAACGPSSSGGDGDGDGDGDDPANRPDARPDAKPIDYDGGPVLNCGQLKATIRDFKADHPDFELDDPATGPDMHRPGLVEVDLGSDKTPVYRETVWPHTSGADNFAQWYHDVDGTNMRLETTIELVTGPNGVAVYDSDAFFPIDGRGFPEEHEGHNFHFTTEIHTSFRYKGGERFTFDGDDDLWLFINGKLALDLGGLHPREEKTIMLDALAATLGIEVGKTYDMDIFHAERQTNLSNFRVETTIDCFVDG